MFMNICHSHGFTNAGVDELLSCLAEHVLPEGHCAPRSLFCAKQLLRKLNLHYEKFQLVQMVVFCSEKSLSILMIALYVGVPR
jgi:hypothetical protein